MIETTLSLNGVQPVQNLFRHSLENPGAFYVIFKNSTRCATSRLAWKAFESGWQLSIPVYLVQVIENRPVSDEITRLSGIRHESPQLLLIREGKVIHHASHSAIDAREVMRLVDSEPR